MFMYSVNVISVEHTSSTTKIIVTAPSIDTIFDTTKDLTIGTTTIKASQISSGKTHKTQKQKHNESL